VTARRVSATQVEFSWAYINMAPDDTYRLQVSGGTGASVSVVTKPDVVLPVAAGHSVCVTVTVRSADGQASPPSDPQCWPG
jgi:hypothetical protein